MNVDPATNELFIADGYKNHRVIVFDAQTGAYKRHWGANGRPPGDPSVKSFGNPVHCARLAKDGLLYVCDRMNNRIQVFKKDGTFVKEFIVAPATRGNGSVWDLDVSHDAPQTWLYNADGENNHIWTLLRDNGQIVGKFGRNGGRPVSSTGCTTWRSTRRATSTRRKSTRASGPRSSCSRAWVRPSPDPGAGVATPERGRRAERRSAPAPPRSRGRPAARGCRGTETACPCTSARSGPSS
jgi:hypothetical protein